MNPKEETMKHMVKSMVIEDENGDTITPTLEEIRQLRRELDLLPDPNSLPVFSPPPFPKYCIKRE